MYIASMNFETMTYDMKILTLPTADERLRTSLRAAADVAPRGRAVSGLLIWLRLWLTCLGLERFSQNRSSTPQDPPPAIAFAQCCPCRLCAQITGQSTSAANYGARSSGLALLCGFASFKWADIDPWAIHGACL